MSYVLYFGKDSERPTSIPEATQDYLTIHRIFFSKQPFNPQSFEIKQNRQEKNNSNNNYEELLKKKKIKLFQSQPAFKKVFTASETTFIIDSSNELWAFGNGSKGQLGINSISNKLQQSANVSSICNINFVQIALGQQHTLGISDKNQVYAWGDPQFGKQAFVTPKTQKQENILEPKIISIRKFINKELQNQPVVLNNDIQKSDLKSKQSQQYNVSFSTSKILNSNIDNQFNLSISDSVLIQNELSDRQKLIHQKNSQFQVKQQQYIQEQTLLQELSKSIKFEAVTCTDNCSFVIVNGQVYSFGKNDSGVIGVGNGQISFLEEPTMIQFPVKIAGISASSAHVLAWDINGGLYAWGESIYGQLGLPITQGYSFNKIECTPQKVTLLNRQVIKQASAGRYYSCALTEKGEIYGWGKGLYSSNTPPDSLPSIMESLYPKKLNAIDSYSKGVRFIKISCGYSHNAAIDQLGYVYTWGDCTDFALGHDTMQDQFAPKLVQILKNKSTIDVACGKNYTIVIQIDKENDASGMKSVLIENQLQTQNEVKNRIKQLQDIFKARQQVQEEIMEEELNAQQQIQSPQPLTKSPSINDSINNIEPFSPLNIAVNSSNNNVKKESFFKKPNNHNKQDNNNQKSSKRDTNSQQILRTEGSIRLPSINQKQEAEYLSTEESKTQTNLKKIGTKEYNQSSNKRYNLIQQQSQPQLQLNQKSNPLFDLNQQQVLNEDEQDHLNFIMGQLNVQKSQRLSNQLQQSLQQIPQIPQKYYIKKFMKYNSSLKEDDFRTLSVDPSKIHLPGKLQKSNLALIQHQGSIAQMTEITEFIYDKTADHITQMERCDPLSIPINKRGQNNMDHEYDENAIFMKRDGYKAQIDDTWFENRANQNQPLPLNTKTAEDLSEALVSKNDLLKYEYIEMVRRGYEEEHLKYLLSNPKDRETWTKEKIKQIGKNIEQYQIEKQKDISFIDFLNEVRAKIKQTDDCAKKIIRTTKQQEKRVQQILEIEKINYKEILDSHKIDIFSKYKPMLEKICQSSEAYQQFMEQNLTKSAQLLNQRTEQAEKKRYSMLKKKSEKIKQQLYLKSEDYKQYLIQQEKENQLKAKYSKMILESFALEQWINFFRKVSQYGLIQRRVTFKLNYKARIIQLHFKKYQIIKKINFMSSAQLRIWNNLAFRQKRKRFCKIIRMKVLKNLIFQKVKTKLVKFRHCILKYKLYLNYKKKLNNSFLFINQYFIKYSLQKFISYLNSVQAFQIGLNSYLWDQFLIQIAKDVPDAVIQRILKRPSPKDIVLQSHSNPNTQRQSQPIQRQSTILRNYDQLSPTKFEQQQHIFSDYNDFYRQFKSEKLRNIAEILVTGTNKLIKHQKSLDLLPSFILVNYGEATQVVEKNINSSFQKKQQGKQGQKQHSNNHSMHTGQNQQSLHIQIQNQIFEEEDEKQPTLESKRSQNVQQYILATILPYSIHSDMIQLNSIYKMTYESGAIHQNIKKQVEAAELKIKLQTITNFIFKQKKEYLAKYTKYQKDLQIFIQQNKNEINLERAKLLLRTSPSDLKIIDRKEEYEFKNNLKTGKNTFIKKDHLPFSTVIMQIAQNMPNAPKQPKIDIQFNFQQFKDQFDNYYKTFKIAYNQIANTYRQQQKQLIKQRNQMKRMSGQATQPIQETENIDAEQDDIILDNIIKKDKQQGSNQSSPRK